MATKQTIKIVKSTAPVLALHGEAITKIFYKRLFFNNPMLKNMFNMTNQIKGTQGKALANSVFMYAQNIDDLPRLTKLVESIAQKHSSLNVKPSMYRLVGENLLAAIQEVLGEAATADIMQAWEEAYADLANIFIGREEELYHANETKQGGWRETKRFKVFKKVKESTIITSFYLKPVDGKAIPGFMAGQYISLSVAIPKEPHLHTRNYSLSDCAGKDYLRISVKREETSSYSGKVSCYLHDFVEEGTVLELGAPSGEFTLIEEKKPVVLISGGVGITPLLSMFNELVVNSNREIHFFQAFQNSDAHAFKNHILGISKENKHINTYVFYDKPLDKDEPDISHDFDGFISYKTLSKILPSNDMAFYFCGPIPFMKNVNNILKEMGIEDGNIHYEFFGPSEEL